MKGRIALFIHQPKCSVQSANGIIKALSPDYTFKIFTRHDLENDFFDDVDMICVPGGIGDSESFKYLMKEHQDKLKEFISNGGKYLGICMGAYWAGKHYLDILNDLDTVQYITRPGTDTRRPHAKGLEVTWNGKPEKMFFYDGCSIIGPGPKQVWSTYANGDPMAVIQGNIGLIGCHPESELHWYKSYSWMPRHWHQGHHHKLLLEFVDEMMKN